MDIEHSKEETFCVCGEPNNNFMDTTYVLFLEHSILAHYWFQNGNYISKKKTLSNGVIHVRLFVNFGCFTIKLWTHFFFIFILNV